MIRYKKTGGAADGSGENYEWKMLTLVYLRMLSAGCEFQLASNMEEAGLFDDIVLRYRKHSSDPWKVSYLQLKHKQKLNKNIPKRELTSLGPSGDFSLIKYCSSCESVMLHMELYPFEEMQFILFTNASLNDSLVDSVESASFFNTGGKVVSFNSGGEVYRELCEWVDFKKTLTELDGQIDGLSSEEVGIRVKHALTGVEYKKKAVSASKNDILNCPTTLKLKELLKKLAPVSDKATYSSFLAKLQVYTDQAHESQLDAMIKEELSKVWICSDVILTEAMFHALIDGVKSWWQNDNFFLTNHSHLWFDLVKSQTEAFSKTTIDGLTKNGVMFAKSALQVMHEKINEIANSGGIFNLRMDSRTAASSLKMHQALAEFKNVIHVNVRALLDREDDVLSAWATRWCPVLVVECDADIEHDRATRISERILNVVDKIDEKKLLVLIAPEKHELNVQLFNAKNFSSFNDNATWSDLESKSTEVILSNKVFFNGSQSTITLSELFSGDKSLVKKVNMDVISQLIREDIACGKDLEEVGKFFVTRRLQESADGVPFVVDSVSDVQRKVVLVVAEPGMGKSTLIKHLAKSAKAENSTAWIVHIKLNDCSQYLKEINAEHFNDVAVKMFLTKCSLDPDNCFEKLLFTALEHNLVFFFDGVDEVCPHYEKQVFKLMSFLKDRKFSQIWIASRPVLKSKLEEKLKVKAFNLVAFSEEDRAGFFNKVWGDNVPLATPEECNEATESLLTWLANSLGKDNPILGVPLMTAMVAETYQDRMFAVDGFNCEFMKNERLDFMNLYETFVKKKFDYYCVEKKKTQNRELAANLKDEEKLLHQMFYNHRLAAMRVLFNPEEIAGLEFEGKEKFDEDLTTYLQEVSDGREKIGIIDNVTNGIPHFVHRSFAEYFTANWLATNFQLNRKLVEQVIFNSGQNQVSNMFHRSLTGKHPLHVAVLNKDFEAAKRSLRNQPEPANVNALDAGGRTPLHLAVLLSATDPHPDSIPIVELLLEHKASLDVADEVLGWTPLRYAERSGAWEAIHVMLENGFNASASQNIWPRPDPSLMLEVARNASVLVLRYMAENFIGPNGENLVHRAAEVGNIELLQHLNSNGVPLNFKDNEGNTALRYASPTAMRYLLDHGLDLEAVNDQGFTALQAAAQNGAYENLAILLEAKGGFIVSSGVGISQAPLNASLLCAAFAGSLESVQTLIEMGASLEHRDNNGHTAAWVSMHRGHVGITDWLLLRGSQDGDTPLHGACRTGEIEIVNFFLARGADIESRGHRGRTPLLQATWNKKMDIVKLLLEKGADPKSSDEECYSSLHHASSAGHDDAVSLLLRYGADVNVSNKFGRTPLQNAMQNNNLEVVRLLLENGANTECRDEKGCTPLNYASFRSNDQAVSLLLRHGADVNAANKTGHTPFHNAVMTNKLAMVQLLLDQGANIDCGDEDGCTPLYTATYMGLDEVVSQLLRHGADVNAASKTGHTPLHYGIVTSQFSSIPLLLEKGANIDCRDEKGMTPLYTASSMGNAPAVSLLLRHGADVNAANNEGFSPLFIAVMVDKLTVMQLLLENGASTESRYMATGWTPLHYASNLGNDRAVSLLLQHGADVNATDNNGRTPLDYAQDHTRVVEMLKAKFAKSYSEMVQD